MRAYKCDRCGKFFEKYDGQGTAEFFNITFADNKNPSSYLKILDLCPKCNSELQEWVANVKSKEEQSNDIRPSHHLLDSKEMRRRWKKMSESEEE